MSRVSRERIHVHEGGAARAKTQASDSSRRIPTLAFINSHVRSEIVDADWRWDGDVELGFWLVGTIDHDEIVVHNIYASSGGDPVGRRNAVPLDFEWAARQHERASRAGWKLVDYLHSRPGSPVPSAKAKEVFLELSRGLNQPFLCLIATQPQAGLLPNLGAWLAADRQLRPLHLKIEGGI